MTNGMPKPLAVVGDKTILERSVSACARAGLNSVLLVSGYRHEAVREAAMSTCGRYGVSCEIVFNADFATKNNCYSLLLAMREIGCHDVLLINGDVVFDFRILRAMQARGSETALAVDSSITLDKESMKVTSDGRRLLGLSKKLDIASSFGEYIGIATVSSGDVGTVRDSLADVVLEEPGEYYEAAFDRLSRHQTICVVDIAGLAWQEIDTADDFNKAVTIVKARGFEP